MATKDKNHPATEKEKEVADTYFTAMNESFIEKGAQEIPDTYFASMNQSVPREKFKNSRGRLCSKGCACTLILLAMVTAAAFACIVILFLEVVELKSEISALQSASSSEVITNDSTTTVIKEFSHRLVELEKHVLQVNNSFSSLEEREYCEQCDLISQLNESVTDLYQMLEQKMLLLNQYTALPSCAALPPSFPSGYYWLRASNGSAVRMYCDITRSCGGVTGGWTRVAELDTTSNNHQCPSGFAQRTDGNISTCVRVGITPGCPSSTFPTLGISYSRVCGRITGYQFGTTDGFAGGGDINSGYVDGISLTHGNPRQHIWSFAVGLDRNANHQHVASNCPCLDPSAAQPPSFVGSDYFCDAGIEQFMSDPADFYPVPLWTDASCLCCTNPPWFHKQLPQPTTDDIEMRVCTSEPSTGEEIPIQVLEIYIQ